jgi:hypothetical protein
MNCKIEAKRVALLLAAMVVLLLATPLETAAQRGGPAATPGARGTAPVDMTGYWVSVISEDWKFRMVTPPAGEYGSVPLNPEGRRIAESWDPSKDEAAGSACKAYGAGGIMRMPGRLRVTWQNDNALQIDTDAGTQTRLFQFARGQSSGETTWQGNSVAQWQSPGGGGGMPSVATIGAGGLQERGGTLKVVTTQMRPGYLRKNGVPYGSNAVMTEYYELHSVSNGDQLLVVTTIVEDPEFLSGPYVTSANFKKLPDASGWNPTPCSAR